MEFKVPFTFSNIDILKKKSKKLAKFFDKSSGGKLEKNLKSCNVDLDSSQYISICFRSLIINFIALLIIFTAGMGIFGINDYYLYGPGISILISLFIFGRQLTYPKLYSSKKDKLIEKNLLSVLEDMLVQLDSGVPIYKIMVNISSSDYGPVSDEFEIAVKEINSGTSQIEALEGLIEKNDSEYFKRILWQLSNGLRSGSDMSIVIQDSIDNLNKEQAIQIQNYGNRLNPLVMFYMLIAVIVPSLGLTFLIILSSMLGVSSDMVKILFIGSGFFIVIFQIMFLGLIKTRRPSLI